MQTMVSKSHFKTNPVNDTINFLKHWWLDTIVFFYNKRYKCSAKGKYTHIDSYFYKSYIL